MKICMDCRREIAAGEEHGISFAGSQPVCLACVKVREERAEVEDAR